MLVTDTTQERMVFCIKQILSGEDFVRVDQKGHFTISNYLKLFILFLLYAVHQRLYHWVQLGW